MFCLKLIIFCGHRNLELLNLYTFHLFIKYLPKFVMFRYYDFDLTVGFYSCKSNIDNFINYE